ncbi:MAG TPA: AAA family ATPase [Streptosporangiaceae bacterium]|nr:AAA family ATPase [Streptosporangiaceae bacterium]
MIANVLHAPPEAHPPRVAAARAASIRLRGRDGELALLQEHLAVMTSGAGATQLIEGGPGLGKTSLVEHAMAAARTDGVVVCHAVAEPSDAAVELAVLMDALCEGSDPLLDRTALGSAHASREQRYWVLQDIQTLLEQAALKRPILICLDDLQWADSGTLAAARALPARLASLPIGWVMAFRTPEPGGDLARAAAELIRNGADKTVLGRLDSSAVAAVAADVLGAVPDEPLLALAEGARGNPFFLMELLSGLREEGLVSLDAGHARLVEGRLPRRTREGMRRRLARMSPSARKVAAIAGSMGRRFTVAQLAAALGMPPSSLLDPVQELIASELFAEAEDYLGFTHDLNREAVRASQPPSAVHALDRQVASALLAAGALPVEVAVQLASSAAPGDEVAVSTLMKACDTIGGTDPGQAADLALRALDLTTEKHPLRGPLVARVAIFLSAAARGDEARAFADTALREVLPAAQEAQVRLSIASSFCLSPEVRAQTCRQALDLDGVPADLRARLLVQFFYSLVVAGRSDQAETRLREAQVAVESTGNSAARFILELAESAFCYTRGDFERALSRCDAALRSCAEVGEDHRLWLARDFRSRILAVMGRFDEAQVSATEGIRSAQQARQGRGLQLFEGNRARQLLQLGNLTDAAAALEGRFSPEENFIPSVLEADAVVVLGRIAIHTGDQRQTELTASMAEVMLKSGVPGIQRHAAWLLAMQADALGDHGKAVRQLAALGESERLSVFPLFPLDPADDPLLVRIALAGGDKELAESAVAGSQQRAQHNPGLPVFVASELHARGLLTSDAGLLAQAVNVLESGPRRLALASALEDLAAAQVSTARRSEAIASLDRALAIYAACGARSDLSRVRRELRELGIQRRLPAERRPTHGWGALTDSEVAVVRLVSDGLTNREVAERLYVSSHTVSGHLRHAFEKLGINSRVALTRIVTERPELP